jgi:hypothetical protein
MTQATHSIRSRYSCYRGAHETRAGLSHGQFLRLKNKSIDPVGHEHIVTEWQSEYLVLDPVSNASSQQA